MRQEPQLTPSDFCYTILQDHGSDDGGWGVAAIAMPGLQGIQPVVYTGSNEDTIAMLRAISQAMAATTEKPTKLVRFTNRVDVASFDAEGEFVGGENEDPDAHDRA